MIELGTLGSAVVASVALAVTSGFLGTFVVLRRESLFGDAISHAVFPGIVLGFFVSQERNPLVVLGCALLAGALGAFAADLMRRTTRLKSDASLGIVLSVFFALGIALYSVRQTAGVRSFFYGMMGAIDGRDLLIMGAATLLVGVAILVCRRPLLVASFDESFAHNLGYPVGPLNRLFAGLLAMAVVVAMQAVGVILVTAMLITPAATAHLLTDRFLRMLWLSVLFALVAGVGGSLLSYQVEGLPAGPLVALAASGLFALAYFFAPRQGVVARTLKARAQRKRIGRENALKDLYRLAEATGFSENGVALEDYRRARRLHAPEFKRELRDLEQDGALIRRNGEGRLVLTNEGRGQGARVLRNHRLWELYLTNEALYEADHVHDDAEIVEHLLGEEAIRRLEEQLGFPESDPHGKPIPVPGDGPPLEER